MTVLVHALDRPDVPPIPMPDRFRHEVAYFIDVSGTSAGSLPAGEYRVDPRQAQRWLDEGAIQLVSPLDSQNQTEVELSEEQEAWLEWITANQISRILLS